MTIRCIQVDSQQLSPTPAVLTGSDPLWIRIRPGLRRGAAIASDALSALGKNLTLHGHGRNEQEDIGLAAAWIRARQISHLIMWDAHELTTRTLPTAVAIAERSGVHLWLVYGAPVRDALLRRLAEFPRDELGSIPVTAPLRAPEPSTKVPWDLGMPAEEPFFLFRTRVPDAQSLQVIAYERQMASTMVALEEAGDAKTSIRQALTNTILEGDSDASMCARVKGIQAAAWHHDIYVSIDFDRLLNSPERPRVPPHETDHLLLAYRQPLRAIAVGLALRGVGIKDITGLSLSDITDIGHLPPSIRIDDPSPALCLALRAQRLLRVSQGASPDDPLLPLAQRTLTTYVHQAGQDLGIYSCVARIPTMTNRNRWLNGLGIRIESLA